MNFSDDDKHLCTLQVLRETLDYLERLPPVPVTREFCRRLQAHLDDPTQRLIVNGRREMSGVFYSPEGLPLLSAKVVDDRLRLRVPTSHQANELTADAMRAELAGKLVDLLATEGLTVFLKPPWLR